MTKVSAKEALRQSALRLVQVAGGLGEIAPTQVQKTEPHTAPKKEAEQSTIWINDGLAIIEPALSTYNQRLEDNSLDRLPLLTIEQTKPRDDSERPNSRLRMQLWRAPGGQLSMAYSSTELELRHERSDRTIFTARVFETENKAMVITTLSSPSQESLQHTFPLELEEAAPEAEAWRTHLTQSIVDSARGAHDVLRTLVLDSLSKSSNIPDAEDLLVVMPFPNFGSQSHALASEATTPTTIEPGRPLQSEDTEQSDQMAQQLSIAARRITSLERISPQDLPYASSDPDLAQYVADNSLAMYGEDHSVLGLLSAQPESSNIHVQVFTDSPQNEGITLSFTATGHANEPTIEIAQAPSQNPFVCDNTTIKYPTTKAVVESSSDIAQALFQRVLVDDAAYTLILPMRAKDGTAYAGMPPERMSAFTMRMLTAAVVDNEVCVLEPIFTERRISQGSEETVPPQPDYELRLGKKRGTSRAVKVWRDDTATVTTFAFEKSRLEGDTVRKGTTTVRLDSEGMHIQQGKNSWLITPALIEERTEFKSILRDLHRSIRDVQDGWTIAQRQSPNSMTVGGQQEFGEILGDIERYVADKGHREFHAPSWGTARATHIPQSPFDEQQIKMSEEVESPGQDDMGLEELQTGTRFNAEDLIDRTVLPEWLKDDTQKTDVQETELDQGDTRPALAVSPTGETVTYTLEQPTTLETIIVPVLAERNSIEHTGPTSPLSPVSRRRRTAGSPKRVTAGGKGSGRAVAGKRNIKGEATPLTRSARVKDRRLRTARKDPTNK